MLFITKQHKKVYCRYLCMPILFLLMTNIGKGQRLSPLIQFMSSNTTIENPPIFREMQANIENEMGSTKPGVNADILFKKIAEVKNILLNHTEFSFKMIEDATTKNVLLQIICKDGADNTEHFNLSITLEGTWKNKSIEVMFNDIEMQLRTKTTELSNKVFQGNFSSVTKKSIAVALTRVLKANFLIGNDDFNDEKLEELLSRILVEQLKEQILKNRDIARNYNEKGKVDDVLIKLGDEINRIGTKLNDKIRDILLKAFTPAEEKLSELIKSYSNVLVSSNTGIGLTGGTGMLNGGVHLSVNFDTLFQGGLYINGELSRPDTNLPSHSLFGLQGRITSKYVQCDLLVSYLFDDKNFKNGSAAEIGLGVDGLIKQKYIIGFGVTYVVSKELSGVNNIVFTLRSANPSSPILMAGISKGGGDKWNSVFNISLPFN